MWTLKEDSILSLGRESFAYDCSSTLCLYPGRGPKKGITSVLLSACRTVQKNLVKLWIWFSAEERNWQKFLPSEITKFELLLLAYPSVVSFHLFHVQNIELLEWRIQRWSVLDTAMQHVPHPLASFPQKLPLLILFFILVIPPDSLKALWVLLFWLRQIHNGHQWFLSTSVLLILGTLWL